MKPRSKSRPTKAASSLEHRLPVPQQVTISAPTHQLRTSPLGGPVDRALAFVTYASRAVPLTAMLDGLPARISAVLEADVVSIYLAEGGGDGLVLRGNVGFDRQAQGTIRLRVGEGLTGQAVALRRPICAVRASGAEGFRRFDELDEDRFPVFLAVPIVGADSRVLGALVAQRASGEFTPSDVVAATLMTAPIAHAVRRDALLDDLRDKPQRRTGGGTRKVMLPGRPLVPGRALGAVAALRRPAKDRPPGGVERSAQAEAKQIDASFDAVERAIRKLEARARAANLVGPHNDLSSFALMASDSRLRERAVELVRQGKGVADALSTVAREVTRAALGAVGDPFLAERSRDIEDLCDAVLMLAAPDARAAVPSKALLVGEKLTLFDLLVTAKSQPVGLALAQRPSPRSEVFARLLGVPVIAGVESIFRWASPGDVALLDADHGLLIINPSRAEVSALRAWRKSHTEGEPAGAEAPPSMSEGWSSGPGLDWGDTEAGG